MAFQHDALYKYLNTKTMLRSKAKRARILAHLHNGFPGFATEAELIEHIMRTQHTKPFTELLRQCVNQGMI